MSSDIFEILKKGESETAEFKGARAPLDALAKAICGMLNQQGGLLLWGVDELGLPVGLDSADTRAKQLNDFVMRHVNPRPLISISVQPQQDEWKPSSSRGFADWFASKKPLVVVDIPQGSDKPYSVNRQIWVRVGSNTLRASKELSATIVERSASQLDRWEREPMPGFGLNDCDAVELAQARSEITKVGRFGIDVPASDEELLRRLYLMKSGQLTNAAVVLFAHQPRAWAPNLAVRIVSYGPDKTGPIANDVILEGPAVRVLKEAVTILQQRTGFSGRFVKGQIEREDRPAYPVFALREGLVNAMVHRDYGLIGGGVQVEVFPKSLVIRNPGKLPEGWSTEDLKEKHESQPGNPDIARVFYLRELMEQLGMGTQKVIAECKELGAKLPVWHAEQGVVSLTLFRAPEPEVSLQLSDRQLKFLRGTKAGAEFKVADFVNATNVSERQARRELAELESFGLLERHGKGPATSYTRTGRPLPQSESGQNPAKSGQAEKK
jgi:ATP-dependent DNA helicase RecG